jgi:hypothetical protein
MVSPLYTTAVNLEMPHENPRCEYTGAGRVGTLAWAGRWRPSGLRFALRDRCRVRCGLLVVALFLLAGPVMPQLGQLFVEGLDRLGALPQQVLDERLLAVLDRLLFQQEFLDGVGWLFFRYGELLF